MCIPPALYAVYRDDHPLVVVQKPAQVGVTESDLLACLLRRRDQARRARQRAPVVLSGATQLSARFRVVVLLQSEICPGHASDRSRRSTKMPH